MVLKNAQVVFIDEIKKCDLKIENGKYSEIADNILPENGEEVIDLTGKYVLSGFIDTHTHGAIGFRYISPDADLNKIAEFEAKNGVTAVTPTFSSYSAELLKPAADNVLKSIRGKTSGAKFIGIHSEGPYLNIERKGGMNEEYITPPTVEKFRALYDAFDGEMKIMTIAPELEGAFDVIEEAVKKGVKVSAGHTSADYDTMIKAVSAGVSRMTHTFNAAVGINHRNPGVLGAALTDNRVNCEVICDFVHLHSAAVNLIYKSKGAKNFTAVSDSLFMAGLPEGEYKYFGKDYTVKGGVAYLPDGTISGSSRTLLDAFHNLLSLDIPLKDITVMMSANPAKALGEYDNIGSIAVGKCADFIVMDNKFDLEKTFVDGVCVYSGV